jgi:radical SAM protein with 4Fe4S-binding SPASM domain
MMLNRLNPGGRGAVHLSIPIQPCLIDLSAYPHLGFGFCAAGSERAYYTLDTAGNLRPCNHTPTVLGNVWEEPFAEIVAPAWLADFVAAVPAFCTDCTLRAECQGGCKAAAQACYGRLDAEEPFLHRHRERARPLVEARPPAPEGGRDEPCA